MAASPSQGQSAQPVQAIQQQTHLMGRKGSATTPASSAAAVAILALQSRAPSSSSAVAFAPQSSGEASSGTSSGAATSSGRLLGVSTVVMSGNPSASASATTAAGAAMIGRGSAALPSQLLLRGVSNAGSSRGSVDSSGVGFMPASSNTGAPPHESAGHLWQTISDRTLPLFSGHALRGSIEELNGIVARWANEMSNSYVAVEDLNTLLKSGMTAIAARTSTASNEAFASRLAEAWTVFFGTTLPNIQAIFLPLKHMGLFDAVAVASALSAGSDGGRGVHAVDIRKMAILSFRNYVVWPFRSRLQDVLVKRFSSVEHSIMGTDVIARITQMLLVVSGIGPTHVMMLNKETSVASSINAINGVGIGAMDERSKMVAEMLFVLRQQVKRSMSM